MSQAEHPDRTQEGHRVTVDDVRQLMGASTPHFALQLRERIRALIRNLEPPYRLRFKALKSIVPQRHDFQSAWNAFEESQLRLTGIIQSAVGLALDEVRIESPVYARVSYNVYGALRMLAAHQRRHLWQIEQILKSLDTTHHGRAS